MIARNTLSITFLSICLVNLTGCDQDGDTSKDLSKQVTTNQLADNAAPTESNKNKVKSKPAANSKKIPDTAGLPIVQKVIKGGEKFVEEAKELSSEVLNEVTGSEKKKIPNAPEENRKQPVSRVTTTLSTSKDDAKKNTSSKEQIENKKSKQNKNKATILSRPDNSTAGIPIVKKVASTGSKLLDKAKEVGEKVEEGIKNTGQVVENAAKKLVDDINQDDIAEQTREIVTN
jgi:hypothetical protein